jgi:hypothetical protein
MQTTGEQNYWQSPEAADAEVTAPPSRYVGDQLSDAPQPASPDNQTPQAPDEPAPIAWEASEYVHHEKNMGWFVVLAIATLLLVAFALFVIKSYSFALLIPVMAATIIVFARRPPRILHYNLTAQGLDIDGKHYSYHDFRAFAVIQDGPLYSIMLIPIKRFMPSVNVYFPEEHGEAIVDSFGKILPIEDHDLDFMDQLVRKLRF